MAEFTDGKMRFATIDQGGETKLSVEHYADDERLEIRCMSELSEAKAEELRDWLIAQYP